MLNAEPTYTGDVWVHRINPDGSRELVYEEHNLVVSTGKNLAASRLIANTDGVLSHIGVGSGQTAADITQTALVTPLGANKPFDSAATRNNNVVTAVATFNAGEATGTIWEFGLFNALSAGTMFSRSVGAAGIPKGANDVIAVTWQVTAN
jgi:hypothetical protein